MTVSIGKEDVGANPTRYTAHMLNIMGRIERRFVYIAALVAILHVVFFVGIAALLSSYGGSIWNMVDGDRNEYFILAHSMIAEHNFALVSSIPDTFRTPGYPGVLVVLYLLVSDSYIAVAFLLAIASGITAACIAAMLELLGTSRHTGYLGAALYGAGIGPLYASMSGQGADVLYTMLYTLASLILLRGSLIPSSPMITAIHIGLLMGAATYMRPIGVAGFLPFLAGIAFVTSHYKTPRIIDNVKNAGIAALVFLMTLLPWCIRNQVVTGEFIFSSLPAFNFVEYNIPLYLTAWDGGSERDYRREIYATIGNPPMDLLRNAAYADELSDIMSSFIREHWATYAVFHSFKMIPFFVGSSLHNLHSALIAEAPAMRLAIFPTTAFNITSALLEGRIHDVVLILKTYWVVTLERIIWVGVFALAFLSPLLARPNARRFLIFIVCVIVWNAFLTSPVTQPRYRIPAEPSIWLATAFSISALWHLSRTRSRRSYNSDQ